MGSNISTVPVFPGQFRFLVSQIESIYPGFTISQQKMFHIHIIFYQQCKTYTSNVFLLFDSIIYSNSYLEYYKKHNSFELNKNVILTCIWFDYK